MPLLPVPNEIALQHSRALQQIICTEIVTSGGWISFARYMELALYAPGMGYYSADTVKFGSSGDFVTAPEISSLFGKAVARQAAQVLELMDRKSGDILEFGAGTGKLAVDLLLEMEKRGNLPGKYLILEVSAQLRQQQQELFKKFAPHLIASVDWLGHLPSRFNGLVLANEVLDAMPAHLVTWQDNNLFELGVAWNKKTFEWSERLLMDGELFQIAGGLSHRLDPGKKYISEINLTVPGFIRSLSDILQQGVVLLIDYGFGRSEYYHPQRAQGTLMCHYRHHAHGDPFYLPGLQDITTHVDFSSVVETAINEGLELCGYTTQAHFLINCGITEILAQTPVENTKNYLPLANQLQKLVSPSEMGELFKAIAFSKNIHQPLIGFVSGDKSRLL
ncbi:MAG: SAM-dependent methyltransferase [Nitrosomonadaceae bacterium]